MTFSEVIIVICAAVALIFVLLAFGRANTSFAETHAKCVLACGSTRVILQGDACFCPVGGK